MQIMCKNLPMKTISVPIGEGRSDLCQLLKKVETGVQIILTAHGKPKAIISAYHPQGPPWRVEKPDDLSRYGDLQSPVLEEWK
jgi:prevent-host-death family protein